MAKSLVSFFDVEYRKVLPRIRIRLRRSARANHRFINRTGTLSDSVATAYDKRTRTINLKINSSIFQRTSRRKDYSKYIRFGFRHKGGGRWLPDRFLLKAQQREESKNRSDIDEAMLKALAQYNKQGGQSGRSIYNGI